jgi:hypothetical protein
MVGGLMGVLGSLMIANVAICGNMAHRQEEELIILRLKLLTCAYTSGSVRVGDSLTGCDRGDTLIGQ